MFNPYLEGELFYLIDNHFQLLL
ncbi:Hypothetical protein SSCIU_01202 [Mammaliicoccus sciuri]|nr:Hypothetical protein SSCIU_01202 [Mammaliicoccus sciuri]